MNASVFVDRSKKLSAFILNRFHFYKRYYYNCFINSTRILNIMNENINVPETNTSRDYFAFVAGNKRIFVF